MISFKTSCNYRQPTLLLQGLKVFILNLHISPFIDLQISYSVIVIMPYCKMTYLCAWQCYL